MGMSVETIVETTGGTNVETIVVMGETTGAMSDGRRRDHRHHGRHHGRLQGANRQRGTSADRHLETRCAIDPDLQDAIDRTSLAGDLALALNHLWCPSTRRQQWRWAPRMATSQSKVKSSRPQTEMTEVRSGRPSCNFLWERHWAHLGGRGR